MNTMKTPKGTELPILNLKGKDYLQVAHRLVWFREERPTWAIVSEFVKLEEKYAIARVTIKNDKGDTMATAHKREDASHFPDFMEKAETGALGRCLAYIGYGTQFAADEISEGHRIVDAPQERRAAPATLGKVATVTARIAPEQPWDSDGAPTPANGPYRFKTGKFKMRTMEEVGAGQLEGWVSYWQEQVSKGKEISGSLADDLSHAEEFLAYAKGNHPAQDPEVEEDVPF